MSKRLIPVALLLLVPAVASAQQDPGDLKKRNEQLQKDLEAVKAEKAAEVQRLLQEIEGIRTERNRLQDAKIELERSFDDIKRKLLDEKEKLQNELAKQRRDSALELARLQSRIKELTVKEGGAPGRPAEEDPAAALERKLDTQRITLNFLDTPLEEAVDFLRDLTGVELETTPGTLEGLTIALRGRELGLRALLDLIALNARDAKGEHVELEWRASGGKIVLRRPKQE